MRYLFYFCLNINLYISFLPSTLKCKKQNENKNNKNRTVSCLFLNCVFIILLFISIAYLPWLTAYQNQPQYHQLTANCSLHEHSKEIFMQWVHWYWFQYCHSLSSNSVFETFNRWCEQIPYERLSLRFLLYSHLILLNDSLDVLSIVFQTHILYQAISIMFSLKLLFCPNFV